MGAKKEKEIVVPLSTQKTVFLVEQTLNQIGARIRAKKDSNWLAYKPTGFGLFEQQIVVTIVPISAEQTRVHITSDASFITNLLLAANTKNVKAFQNALQTSSNPQTYRKNMNERIASPLIFSLILFILIYAILNTPNQHVSQWSNSGNGIVSSILYSMFPITLLAFGQSLFGCLSLMLVRIGWNEQGAREWRLILLTTWVLVSISIAVLFWGFQMTLFGAAGVMLFVVGTLFLIWIVSSQYNHYQWLKQQDKRSIKKSDVRFIIMNGGGAVLMTAGMVILGIYNILRF